MSADELVAALRAEVERWQKDFAELHAAYVTTTAALELAEARVSRS